MLDLFDRVGGQQGFVSQTLITSSGASRGFSSVSGALGVPGGAQVRLSSSSDAFSARTRILYHAYNALSELTHVAGSRPSGYVQGAFSDYSLARAAFALESLYGPGVENLRLGLPNIDPNKDPYGKWSDNYHDALKRHCKRIER
jgi:hypothetical protein